MTISKAEALSFRPISSRDAHLFMEKPFKDKKYRPLVGTGASENRDMANAYAVNTHDYPLAHIIESNGSAVGILILENAGKGALELSLITEKVADYYTTLHAVVGICQQEKVPVLYVSGIPGNPTDDTVRQTIESAHDRVKVQSTGTKEAPEYKIVF